MRRVGDARLRREHAALSTGTAVAGVLLKKKRTCCLLPCACLFVSPLPLLLPMLCRATTPLFAEPCLSGAQSSSSFFLCFLTVSHAAVRCAHLLFARVGVCVCVCVCLCVFAFRLLSLYVACLPLPIPSSLSSHDRLLPPMSPVVGVWHSLLSMRLYAHAKYDRTRRRSPPHPLRL